MISDREMNKIIEQNRHDEHCNNPKPKPETYQEMRNRHQQLVDDLPLGFAFSNRQFEEMMEKFGLTVTDTDKIVGIGMGGFIQKKDLDEFTYAQMKIEEEQKDRYLDKDFVYQMFAYELANHEYGYSRELEPTLDALGLSVEEIEQHDILREGLAKALKRYNKY